MFVIDWAFSSPLTYRKYGTREEANPLAKIIPCFYLMKKRQTSFCTKSVSSLMPMLRQACSCSFPLFERETYALPRIC